MEESWQILCLEKKSPGSHLITAHRINQYYRNRSAERTSRSSLRMKLLDRNSATIEISGKTTPRPYTGAAATLDSIIVEK